MPELIPPCQCCCCCKVCPGGGWCVGGTLRLKVYDITWPTCSPAGVCDSRNAGPWIEGMEAEFVRDYDFVNDPDVRTLCCGPGFNGCPPGNNNYNTPTANPCWGWYAKYCGDDYVQGWSNLAGRQWRDSDCTDYIRYLWGCDDTTGFVPEDPAPIISAYSTACCQVYCDPATDATLGRSLLGFYFIYRLTEDSVPIGNRTACWNDSGPDAPSGGVSEMRIVYQGGVSSWGTVTADDPVCDGTGHFVSQVFHWTNIAGNVTGKVMIYAV